MPNSYLKLISNICWNLSITNVFKRKPEIKQIFDQFLEQKEENRRESGFGIYKQPNPKLWEEHALLEGTHIAKNISVLIYI